MLYRLTHHLFNIDVIINRTLVYIPLTAVLAGLCAASISVTQKLFTDATGQQSDAATVIMTLVVVAAFTLAKDRLQALVDKRSELRRNGKRGHAAGGSQCRRGASGGCQAANGSG